MIDKTRNEDLLVDFIRYAINHPKERFWQALRNWSENGYIIAADYNWLDVDNIPNGCEDTFNWEGKNR